MSIAPSINAIHSHTHICTASCAIEKKRTRPCGCPTGIVCSHWLQSHVVQKQQNST